VRLIGEFQAKMAAARASGLSENDLKVQFNKLGSEYGRAFADQEAMAKVVLKELWGWTEDEVARYYGARKKGLKEGQFKVEYLDDKTVREKYAVIPGSTFTHGDPPAPVDTGGMTSKAAGKGFGIFVMDKKGRLFVGQHRVGLFHHSSFLAGAGTAAAGEMQIESGTLKMVTAKSGHYMPETKESLQLLERLAEAGVPLGGVEIKVWVSTAPGRFKTQVHKAAEYLSSRGTSDPVREEGMM
jgi:hypothetical protein